MFRKKFINRENYLDFLNKKRSEEGFEFIIITGRRRIGKSRLLKEFVKDKENIFLLCELRKWEHNLSKFNQVISEYFEIPVPGFKSFSECFSFILKQHKSKEKLIVVIDEFSYLIKKSDAVAEFQMIADEILPDRNVLLVLSGSSVSMMKKNLLEYNSPLYGRSTGQMFIQPLKLNDLFEWFPDTKVDDLIKIFAVCDGIPKYLEFFSGINVEEEIKEKVFNPESFLFREPKFLLEEELREPETYFQILEAISIGYTKVVENSKLLFYECKGHFRLFINPC